MSFKDLTLTLFRVCVCGGGGRAGEQEWSIEGHRESY